MGTWDYGPFDSDKAADWCGDVNDAAAEERPALIRKALMSAIGNDGYLDSDEAAEAIAAAAIVAAQRGGPPITSPYAPDFLLEGGTVEIADDMPSLAVRALDRVVAEESEWRDLWEDSGSFPKAAAVVQELRDVLAGHAPS
jgi:hypothetical protein